MGLTSQTYDEYLEQQRTQPQMKVHHRSSPGPDTRTPWERGGLSKSEYDKLPQKYKDMLN